MRTALGEQDGVWLYQNNYTLPVGFYVAPDFEARWDLETGNPADAQNSLADAVGAEQDVYKRQHLHRRGPRRRSQRQPCGHLLRHPLPDPPARKADPGSIPGARVTI